jgi:ribosomal protein S18 acetylase RimI-like enzyme
MFRHGDLPATPPANASAEPGSPVRVHDRRVPTVRRCPPSGRDRALATVLAAFATDPLLRWVWPGQERYDGCAPTFFGLLLDLRIEAGEVWVAQPEYSEDTAIGSVAMWDPPGGLYLPAAAERWARVHAGFTAAERAAWAHYDDALGVPASAGAHWYLGVLATDPARQGTGLGRAVATPMLAAADRAGLPAYLETASDTNVAIYRRLGFEVAREVDLPDGGPRCWLMRRDPLEVA